MSAFDVIIATDGIVDIRPVMAPYQDVHWEWWYPGGRGWEPHAYIDVNGQWHSQLVDDIDFVDSEPGTLTPLQLWRIQLWYWISNQPPGTNFTVVRCLA